MKKRKGLFPWAVLLAAVGVVIYLCWQMLLPFINVIAWSVVLVITFHPVQQRLVKSTGRRSLSALFSSLLVVLAILIPVLLITGLLINELFGLKTTLQAKFGAGFDPKEMRPVREAMEWLTQHLHVDSAKVLASMKQQASELAQSAAQHLLTFAGGISSLVVSSVFTVFTMFYLFRDGERIVRNIPDLLPFDRSQSENLILRIRDVIDGSIYGVLVIAFIQGALGGVMFWILHLPSAALWTVVMVVASLIPVVGTASVWLPGALYLLLTGHWEEAVVLVAFGVLIIGSVDNFLRPKLVGEKVRLNELVMFFSVLGGLQIFGVLGIVAGPVIFAVAGSLFHIVRQADTKADSSLAVGSS